MEGRRGRVLRKIHYSRLYNVIVFTGVIWVIGILAFVAGSAFMLAVSNKLNVTKVFYYYFEVMMKMDSQKNVANFSITLIIWMFVTSFIFYLLLKYLLLLIPKLKFLKDYYYMNLELLNQCLTLGLVFFGFFPLYLALTNLDKNLMDDINSYVLIFSAGFFVSYISLLAELIFSKFISRNEKKENKCSSENDESISLNTKVEGERVLSINKKMYKHIKKRSTESTVKNRNSWTFTFAVLGITGTICFLLITGKVDIDSSTLLSLILAFFSIYLSAQFYFKATEQSNQFYDRSYNHTRDIAKTLSSMEGRFGEGLKNIEQYSTRLNDRFDNLPFINNSLQENVISETQKNIHEILKAMEGGSISKDEMKKYEEKFFHIENENKELKKALNKNKQDWSPGDKIAFFFHNINRNYGLTYLLNLSTKNLANVIKNEALGYYDDKFLDELINQGIVDNELNLTAEGIDKLKKYLKKINK